MQIRGLHVKKNPLIVENVKNLKIYNSANVLFNPDSETVYSKMIKQGLCNIHVWFSYPSKKTRAVKKFKRFKMLFIKHLWVKNSLLHANSNNSIPNVKKEILRRRIRTLSDLPEAAADIFLWSSFTDSLLFTPGFSY